MDVFAALADPVRRELLAELAGGPVRVADLAGARPISRPAVSRHLRVLAEAGLVVAEDRGRERHYALRREGLEPVSAYVAALHRAGPLTENALDALETEVRRTPGSAAGRPDRPVGGTRGQGRIEFEAGDA